MMNLKYPSSSFNNYQYIASLVSQISVLTTLSSMWLLGCNSRHHIIYKQKSCFLKRQLQYHYYTKKLPEYHQAFSQCFYLPVDSSLFFQFFSTFRHRLFFRWFFQHPKKNEWLIGLLNLFKSVVSPSFLLSPFLAVLLKNPDNLLYSFPQSGFADCFHVVSFNMVLNPFCFL